MAGIDAVVEQGGFLKWLGTYLLERPHVPVLFVCTILAILMVQVVIMVKYSSNVVVRRADQLAVLRAGEVQLRGDSLGRLLQLCHPHTQSRFRCVSRSLRDAVKMELPYWMDSQLEVEAVAYITDKPVHELLTAKSLRLSCCGGVALGAEEGKGVGVLLRMNVNLEALWLTTNQLGDMGASHIAEALKYDVSVRALHLDSNELGDVAAVAIAEGLRQNTSLQYLSLSENGVGAEVHFRHPGESEGIGDEGAKALAESLRVNRVLRSLRLASNEIGDEGVRALTSSLRDNVTLTSLDLRCNRELSDRVKADLLKMASERATQLDILL